MNYGLDGGQVAFLITIVVVGLGLFWANVKVKQWDRRDEEETDGD